MIHYYCAPPGKIQDKNFIGIISHVQNCYLVLLTEVIHYYCAPPGRRVQYYTLMADGPQRAWLPIPPTATIASRDFLFYVLLLITSSVGGGGGWCAVRLLSFCFLFPVEQTTSGIVHRVVVVVVFTLKTVLTSIQYPSLSYPSRQRNEFPWSQANPK